MTIDWDKAPEGATHYTTEPCIHYRWLKESPLSYWATDRWIEHGSTSEGRRQIAAAEPKPPTYKDIGSILEYYVADYGLWREGEVIAHAKGKVVVQCAEDGSIGLYSEAELRPIKTPQELAQEQVDDEIEQMRRIVVKAALEGTDPVLALHSAGARVTKELWI